MNEILRIYGPDELGPDGYPVAWHHGYGDVKPYFGGATMAPSDEPPIKDLIRELVDHRCERCGHPYPPGIAINHPRGEWTPCDSRCTHGNPIRSGLTGKRLDDLVPVGSPVGPVEAHWRILTVHHLNGIKYDCRWWNLAALCQRCHLSVQGRVVMERVWVWEHTEWFKPHAAAWYAYDYLGEELTREETMERLEELLELERVSEIGPC